MTPNCDFELVAPPWNLVGSGYIQLYRFDRDFVQKNGFLKDFQIKNFKGGWGAVMLVNYETSPVGPYVELLFIPGVISIAQGNAYSISKIYVSTKASVENGIYNWGIPKELADFVWLKGKQSDEVKVSVNGIAFFEAKFKKNWFRFPISTALFPLTIIQQLGEKLLLTKPSSKGMAHFAKMTNAKINSAYFPDVSQHSPLVTVKVENFTMKFTAARVISKE